jgi:hypothetical protein
MEKSWRRRLSCQKRLNRPKGLFFLWDRPNFTYM